MFSEDRSIYVQFQQKLTNSEDFPAEFHLSNVRSRFSLKALLLFWTIYIYQTIT